MGGNNRIPTADPVSQGKHTPAASRNGHIQLISITGISHSSACWLPYTNLELSRSLTHDFGNVYTVLCSELEQHHICETIKQANFTLLTLDPTTTAYIQQIIGAGQSHLIFGTGSTGSATTRLLSKPCCANVHYKPFENLDAIALIIGGLMDQLQDYL